MGAWTLRDLPFQDAFKGSIGVPVSAPLRNLYLGFLIMIS